jgi:hypothetical protein
MAYDAYQPARPERPAAVTVIAILVLIYGAMGVIMLPINIAQLYGAKLATGPAAAMMQNPTFASWSRISIPLGGLFSILWIVIGIGLLQLLRWARKLAIGLIVASMVVQVVGMGVMMPVMMQAMATTSFGPGPQPPPELMRAMMTVGVVVAAVIILGLGVLFIVLLTRPNVRYAFEPETDPNYAAYQQQQQYAPAMPSPQGPPAADGSQPPGGYPPAE